MLMKAKNDQTLYSQGLTSLSLAGTAAQTVFTLKNINGFAANYVMQIGETGQERTENLLIAGTPAGNLATASTGARFPHPEDTPVYCYRYNQVVFMVSTAGTAGTAAPIGSGTVSITPDSPYTVFNYASAVATDAYKTKYYNSALLAESPTSDWIEFGGYQSYTLAGIRNAVKSKIDASIEDDAIDIWLNEWRQEMTNSALQVNEDYCMGTTDLSFSGTANEGTITATDYVRPRRVWTTYNGTDWYRATKIDYNEALPDESFNQTQPKYAFRSDNVIVRYPSEQDGTVRIAYDSLGTALVNDGDELPYSMRGYYKSFIDYGLAQAYRHPSINKLKEASERENWAMAQKDIFVQQITPRQRTNADYIDIASPWGLEDDTFIW